MFSNLFSQVPFARNTYGKAVTLGNQSCKHKNSNKKSNGVGFHSWGEQKRQQWTTESALRQTSHSAGRWKAIVEKR